MKDNIFCNFKIKNTTEFLVQLCHSLVDQQELVWSQTRYLAFHENNTKKT